MKRTTPTTQGQSIDKRAQFRKMANGLLRLADEQPKVNIRHLLKNGLKLVVRRDADGYTLGVWRQNVPPSPEEMEVVRDCFGFPADGMCSTLQRHRPTERTDSTPGGVAELWMGYSLSWSAAKVSAQAQLPLDKAA